MSLFWDAAIAWEKLHNMRYIFDVARKGKAQRIELSFSLEDFPHLAGMQYAGDVDFKMPKSEYYGERLVRAILGGKLESSKIEESRNWRRISGRLEAIINLQETLEGDFRIALFDPAKVKVYSQIHARFVIQSASTNKVYFIFLDERENRYYCKSAFAEENIDYMENQSSLTVLRKAKIDDDGERILYTK